MKQYSTKKDEKFFGVLNLCHAIVSLPIPNDTNVFSKVAVPCEEDILSISTKEQFDSAKPKNKNPTRISAMPCVSIPSECILDVFTQAEHSKFFEITVNLIRSGQRTFENKG